MHFFSYHKHVAFVPLSIKKVLKTSVQLKLQPIIIALHPCNEQITLVVVVIVFCNILLGARMILCSGRQVNLLNVTPSNHSTDAFERPNQAHDQAEQAAT